MEPFTCTRLFYLDEEDKKGFIAGYIEWKQDQFNSKEIFTNADVKKAEPEDGTTTHHPALGLGVVMSNVFDRLAKADKQNVAEVCKAWAEMFLVGTETSKVFIDYNKQLVTENVEGMITAEREHRVVQMYCVCRAFTNDEEKAEFHRQLEAGWSDEESFEVMDDFSMWDSENSGSEGYYDSDC